MTVTFDKARWNQDAEGFWLQLRVPDRGPVQRFLAAMSAGKRYVAELKEQRNRRSLDANAYCWVLLDKLATVLRIPKAELYRAAIREIGGNSETVCVLDKAADKLCGGWEHNGLGWLTERFPSKLGGCVNVTLYYGSSTYDTSQMSRLIDTIVQECKLQGIETMTPEELERMKGKWDE